MSRSSGVSSGRAGSGGAGSGGAASPGIDTASVRSEARDVLPEAVSVRRKIHAEPELGLDLPKTQSTVLEALAELDLVVETGHELSSIVATITGDAEGPTLLLRADMDALPMPEDTDLDFASTTDGVMHACGHDAHVAMLVGAAKILYGRRQALQGTVKLLFQPGEEGYHGARSCIEEGVLSGPDVDGAFAIHITPNLASGRLATRPGPFMASADTVQVRVEGKGGHASSPHLAIDPVPVAAELVLALQSMIGRTVDAFDPAVLTIARIAAGTTSNVIPEHAEIEGTLRTVSEKTREQVHGGIHRVAHHVAAAHDCDARVELVTGYPVTVNDDGFAGFVRDVFHDLVGAANVTDMKSPVMGAEDWSYVLQEVPGCMAFLGVCPPDAKPATAAACHSNRMQLDEDAMAVGIAAHVAVALSYLS